ncbi:hypothetical protein OF83DRAFT_406803 [Amylostereum chailletii]|nr:hypothetical protein OF83DRAFT_406803 [Amylostereum chailletii]
MPPRGGHPCSRPHCNSRAPLFKYFHRRCPPATSSTSPTFDIHGKFAQGVSAGSPGAPPTTSSLVSRSCPSPSRPSASFRMSTARCARSAGGTHFLMMIFRRLGGNAYTARVRLVDVAPEPRSSSSFDHESNADHTRRAPAGALSNTASVSSPPSPKGFCGDHCSIKRGRCRARP